MPTYTNLRIHFVWSTKHREPLIDDEWQLDLYKFIGGILRKREHRLLVSGGIEDHIHLLVGLHPRQSISDLVRDIKSNSSAWVHDNRPGRRRFQWQAGYGAFSVSERDVLAVTQYIQNQRKHHRKMTFKTELLMLLERNKIEYDPRYIWE
jgi:putative transposase